MKCAICGKPASHDYVGNALLCPACAKVWADSESNARMVVALDHDLESDERLKAAQAALEAAREKLRGYENSAREDAQAEREYVTQRVCQTIYNRYVVWCRNHNQPAEVWAGGSIILGAAAEMGARLNRVVPEEPTSPTSG